MSIFVSYASDDISHVNSFSKQNADLSFFKRNKLWISYEKNKYEKNIKPGSNFSNKILNSINDSKGAVIFVSNSLLKSGFVINSELPEIFKKKREDPGFKIIPVFVDKVKDFSAFPELENLHYSNTPNTSLNILKGAQYRLTISEILNDCLTIKNYRSKLISSSLIILGVISAILFTQNSNQDNNSVSVVTTVPVTSTTVPVTSTTTIIEKSDEEIEKCVVQNMFLNVYANEHIQFVLERHRPLDPDENAWGFSKSLHNLDWKNSEEMENYVFQYFAHHEMMKMLTDSNNKFYEEEIEYFMNQQITLIKSDLYVLRNDLNNTNKEDFFYEQSIEVVKILDAFDQSLAKLLMYWKSSEGTEEQTEDYSNDYFGEAKQYFSKAILLYGGYKLKYYPGTYKYDQNELNNCGEIDNINNEYIEDVNKAIEVMYTRRDLFDLEAGDCFNMPTSFGFERYQNLEPWGIFSAHAFLVPVGWMADMFPSYIPVSKVDCSSPHQVEIFFKSTVADEDYNFDWVSGIPLEQEDRWSLDIYSVFDCTLESTLYLTYPTAYTGYYIGSFYDAARHRAEERDHMCFYYKYDIDELGQPTGYKKNTGSVRLINERSPRLRGFDYIDKLEKLNSGDCWIDPEEEIFERDLIHKSSRDNYNNFTYIGYLSMDVRVLDCKYNHQNEVIFSTTISGNSYQNSDQLLTDVKNICNSKLIPLIPSDGDREDFGLDGFVSSMDINEENITVICSAYYITPYSDMFHPAGFGDWFITQQSGSLFNS